MPPKSLKTSKSAPILKNKKNDSSTSKNKQNKDTNNSKEENDISNNELVSVEVKEELKGEAKDEIKVEEKIKEKVVLGPPSEADILTYGKALIQSVNEGDIKSLKRFLSGKGNYLHSTVFGYKNSAGNTSLILACQRPKESGAEEIVTELLTGFKNYLDDDDFMKMVDGENKEKQTPLMYAAIKGFPKVIKLLLDVNANFELPNSYGKNAIQLCNNDECIALLVEAKNKKIAIARNIAARRFGIAILNAIKNNDVSGIHAVIKLGPPVEAFSYRETPNHLPPLALAIIDDCYEIAELLLLHGADPAGISEKGITCVMRIVNKLRLPSYPTTNLSRIKEEKRFHMLNLLLVPEDKNHLYLCDPDGFNCLMLATIVGYEEDVKLLIDSGMDPDGRQEISQPYKGLPKQRKNNGDTPLIMATRRNNLSMMKLLIEYGKVDINKHGMGRMYPVSWAAFNGCTETLDYLMNAGANLNAQSNFGETPLFWSINQYFLDSATKLLNFEPKVAERLDPKKKDKDKKGGSSIGNSSNRSGFNMSKEIAPLEPKKPNSIDKRAANDAEAKLLEKLEEEALENEAERITRRSNPNITCKNNASPLLLLCRHSSVLPREKMLELVSLLLAKGADVNNYSHDLLTPIQWGTMHNDMDLLKILISAGGNPLIKNSNLLICSELTENIDVQMLVDMAGQNIKKKEASRAFAEKQRLAV